MSDTAAPKKKGGCLKVGLIIFGALILLMGGCTVLVAVFAPDAVKEAVEEAEAGAEQASQTSNDNNLTTSSSSTTPKKAEPKKAPVSEITWKELDEIYSLESDTSDLQKKAKWPEYKGKKVKWSGKVAEVGESFGSLTLQVHMKKGLLADVIVTLYPNQKDKALKLSKDDDVKFIAELDRYGSILPISLKNGVIVDWE